MWDGRELTEGEAVAERARWAVDGQSLIEPPVVGTTVALHWDWVCDEISAEQAERIKAMERQALAAV